MKDVNNEIHEVENDPAGLTFSLAAGGLALFVLEKPTLDLIGYRPDLSLGIATTDKEVVGDDEYL